MKKPKSKLPHDFHEKIITLENNILSNPNAFDINHLSSWYQKAIEYYSYYNKSTLWFSYQNKLNLLIRNPSLKAIFDAYSINKCYNNFQQKSPYYNWIRKIKFISAKNDLVKYMDQSETIINQSNWYTTNFKLLCDIELEKQRTDFVSRRISGKLSSNNEQTISQRSLGEQRKKSNGIEDDQDKNIIIPIDIFGNSFDKLNHYCQLWYDIKIKSWNETLNTLYDEKIAIAIDHIHAMKEFNLMLQDQPDEEYRKTIELMSQSLKLETNEKINNVIEEYKRKIDEERGMVDMKVIVENPEINEVINLIFSRIVDLITV